MSQEQLILNHLQSGHSLSQLECLEKFQCMRLASRVNNLRSQGFDIKTRIVHNENKHWAEYFIPQEITLTAVQCGKQEQLLWA